MDLLEPDDIPLTIHEDIINYLKGQDALEDDNEEFLQNVTNFTEGHIRDILEELLQKFEKTTKLKDKYAERVKAHNQHSLFNLKSILPDFNIDDEMYDALTFRETLIIQRLIGTSEVVVEPVGGLCLDIQQASGKQPCKRKSTDIDACLARIVNKDVVDAEDVQLDDEAAKVSSNGDVRDLEDSLETQADRNTDKFLIHLSSQFDLDGFNAGSTITSWVDRNLHTLEEARKEFYVKEIINNETNKDIDNEIKSELDEVISEKINKETNERACKKGSQKLCKISDTSGIDEEMCNRIDDMTDKRKQMEKEDTKLIEKSLYVGLLKGFYYIKHVSNENEDIDDRKFYSLRKAKDYISEGASFLLQRYLARTIYIGTLELSTMYINGDMCRNIYECTGPESKIINDRRIDICRIQRTIIEECGIEHKCLTTLTLQGQIVHQHWEGTPYILQINPLLDVSNYKPVSNEEVLLKHAWESDMQLMSKYLDEKISSEIKIKSYMIDHPEFRNMISDYIHAILLLKPEDIIDFTINHFLSFAPQYLPQNDYFINF